MIIAQVTEEMNATRARLIQLTQVDWGVGIYDRADRFNQMIKCGSTYLRKLEGLHTKALQ